MNVDFAIVTLIILCLILIYFITVDKLSFKSGMYNGMYNAMYNADSSLTGALPTESDTLDNDRERFDELKYSDISILSLPANTETSSLDTSSDLGIDRTSYNVMDPRNAIYDAGYNSTTEPNTEIIHNLSKYDIKQEFTHGDHDDPENPNNNVFDVQHSSNMKKVRFNMHPEYYNIPSIPSTPKHSIPKHSIPSNPKHSTLLKHNMQENNRSGMESRYSDNNFVMPELKDLTFKKKIDLGNIRNSVLYGSYGDVPVQIFTPGDLLSKREWGTSNAIQRIDTKSLDKYHVV